MLDAGIGIGTSPVLGDPGTELTIDVRGKHRRARTVKADLQARGVRRVGRELPLRPQYHPGTTGSHRSDTATLGITWYGQDALGELVHYEPPDVGATLSKDGAYGEVESVKAVSDLIAPLSGEVLEVNEKVVDAPETVNEDPYGDGWLVKIRIADPAEADALMDAGAYKSHLETL
jgi:glycine cleavage system H protein